MLKYVLNITLVCFLTTIVALPVVAQTRGDLAKQIQRLDRDLERARELVNSFDNRRALELVNQAIQLRTEAVRLLEKNSPTKRDLTEAAARIKMARAKLITAAKLTLDGPVRRLRSELEELLIRADDLVGRSANREAQRTLNEAKKNRNSAERAASSMQIEKAVEHFRVAVTLGKRSIQLASGSGNADIDKLREERRKFENLQDRALELLTLHPNDRAEQVYRQAVNSSKSAENAFHNGDIDLARRLLNQSVLLMLRAIDLSHGDARSVSIDRVDAALFQVKDLLERSRELIAASGRPRAKVLLERARRFIQDAEIAARSGRGNEALTKIELARNMLRRAERLSGAGVPRQFVRKVTDEISKTKIDIVAARASLGTDAPRDADRLIRMAEWTLRRAEKAAASGFRRLALEAVLASQRFLARADQLSKRQSGGVASKEQTQVRLGQLDAAISETEQNLNGATGEWNRQLLQSAKDIRKLAKDSFNQGNYRAANEAVQVSLELLRKSSRKSSNN